MKAATILQFVIGLLMISFFLPALQSLAQESGYPEPSEKYSQEELAQMLAPIALYPDALLAQVLMASTYPIEVIEADRWVKKNPDIKGADLDTALLEKDWDPSVKALCHFPPVLNMMSERITQTTNLGNAFLAQEQEVMDMIQDLRAKAHAQGNLVTTSEQNIIVEQEKIIIVPADPQVIYVPYYDPFFIYGPWWYPYYPPYYWAPNGVRVGRGISYWPRFYFGFAFGSWSYFDWHRHYIHIDVHKRPRYVRSDRWIAKPGPWFHAPRHRRGVAYRDKPTARKYGQYPYSSRNFKRDTRGFPERHDSGGFQLPHRTIPLDEQRSRFQFPDRTMPWEGRSATDRDRLEQEQVERNRQLRERTERERRDRTRIEQERQQREQIEQRSRQMREPAVSERRDQPRVEQERRQREQIEQRSRQMREPAVRERQDRTRVEQGRQQRERLERDAQVRQRLERARQVPQRVERVQQQRSRDNVFNRVDDGRRERQSSERGRVSRQQGRIEQGRPFPQQGGVKRDNRGGRDNRGKQLR